MDEKKVDQWRWVASALALIMIALGFAACGKSTGPIPQTGSSATAVESASNTAAPATVQEPISEPAVLTPDAEPVQEEAAPTEPILTVRSTATEETAGVRESETSSVDPADPDHWDLGEGRPEPNNPAFTVYDLSEAQLQMALRPIYDFFNGMYYSDHLLTPDEAGQRIDVESPAWTDPESGFQVSYDSFSEAGYYPRYQFPVDNPDYYTQWRITPYRSPESDFYVVVIFRMEEQDFTVYEEATGDVIVTTPYWGPRQLMFHTAYRDGSWKIIFRHDEDLGTKATTPTS